MKNENQDEIASKEEEDEYIDKIKYLGKDMSKSLERYQKYLWLKTITWYMLADNLKDRIRDFIEKKVKTLDITIIILAFLGVVTNLLQMSFYLNFTVLKENNFYSINIEGKSSNLIEGLRIITSLSTLIIIILVYFHYRVKRLFLIFKHEIPFNSLLFSKNLIFPMVVEIIVLIIHTPPFFNDVYINYKITGNHEETIHVYLDLFISAFILSRVYLLFKYYANYSKWGGVFASMVCSECNAKGGFIFTYKAGIKEHSFLSVFIFIIFTILIFGYGVRNCEISFVRYVPSQYFQDWTKVTSGFWFMTTNTLLVGYGDYYPTTVLGRLISFVTCIWGIILEGILIKAIVGLIKMDKKEEIAYNEVEKYLEECNYKKMALKLIYTTYNTHLIVESLKVNNNAQKGEIKDSLFKQRKLYFNNVIWKLKKSLREFSKVRKNKEKKEREISVQNLMMKINLEINDNMNFLLINIQTQINTLLENMNQAQDNQDKIQLFTKILEVTYNSLNNKVKERTKSNGQVPDYVELKNKGNLSRKNLQENNNIENEFKHSSKKNIIL
jgi:hypothetical protein